MYSKIWSKRDWFFNFIGEPDVDECEICNGEMFLGEEGLYPGGSCDCEGTLPFTYCYDLDGDGLGNPDLDILNYPFQYCELNNNEGLVLDCSDPDDSCESNQQIDECGVCGGFGPDEITKCCLITSLSISGAPPDDCGICGGGMFLEQAPFLSSPSDVEAHFRL